MVESLFERSHGAVVHSAYGWRQSQAPSTTSSVCDPAGQAAGVAGAALRAVLAPGSIPGLADTPGAMWRTRAATNPSPLAWSATRRECGIPSCRTMRSKALASIAPPAGWTINYGAHCSASYCIASLVRCSCLENGIVLRGIWRAIGARAHGAEPRQVMLPRRTHPAGKQRTACAWRANDPGVAREDVGHARDLGDGIAGLEGVTATSQLLTGIAAAAC